MGLIKKEITVKLISKYFLIFNILLFYQSSLIGQDSTATDTMSSLEDKKSILALEDQKTIYPGKPLIMSLVVPGAGQFYNQSPMWKSAMFFGTEIISILAWRKL